MHGTRIGRCNTRTVGHHRDKGAGRRLLDVRIARRIVGGIGAVARMLIVDLLPTFILVDRQRSLIILENMPLTAVGARELGKPCAASAIRRIPCRTILQIERRAALRRRLGTARPLGIHSI